MSICRDMVYLVFIISIANYLTLTNLYHCFTNTQFKTRVSVSLKRLKITEENGSVDLQSELQLSLPGAPATTVRHTLQR